MRAGVYTSLVVASLLAASPAYACSPIPEVMSGVQFYRSIVPDRYSNWDKDKISVGLVFVQEKRRKNRKIYTGTKGEKNKKPFVKVKYKLIENISGNFIKSESEWLPKITEKRAKHELGLIGSEKEFSFWERRDLTIPKVSGYSIPTSCGSYPSPTALSDQYYLHFKTGERTVGMEIVSGPEDALVAEFRKIYSDATETKIARQPADYFRDISGYSEVELIKCPPKDIRYMGAYGFGYDFDHGAWSGRKLFREISSFNSDIDSLRLIDFFAYREISNGPNLRCTVGEKYLVLDEISARVSRGDFNYFPVKNPQHRYLKISNGSIQSREILSKIDILGNEDISVDLVKSWISEKQ